MVTTAPSRGLHVIRRAGELEGGTRDGLSRSGQQVGVEPDMNRERERERGGTEGWVLVKLITMVGARWRGRNFIGV